MNKNPKAMYFLRSTTFIAEFHMKTQGLFAILFWVALGLTLVYWLGNIEIIPYESILRPFFIYIFFRFIFDMVWRYIKIKYDKDDGSKWYTSYSAKTTYPE